MLLNLKNEESGGITVFIQVSHKLKKILNLQGWLAEDIKKTEEES